MGARLRGHDGRNHDEGERADGMISIAKKQKAQSGGLPRPAGPSFVEAIASGFRRPLFLRQVQRIAGTVSEP
jgi:hypothetical protein